MLQNWLKNLFAVPNRSARRSRKPARTPLAVEALEGREVPATTLTGSVLQLGVNDGGDLIRGGVGARFLGVEYLNFGTPIASFTVAANGTTRTNATALGVVNIPMTLTDTSAGTTH